ncbi:DUF3221 domain-containing protein [Bacillus sp. FJAT-29814]|uniref:DUF3221 domain-containing protein n=1 Tax=Bacillus sp. FJAT-29814 TaxID=1729688 RepID=UPI00083091B3|nr:DUF3221 domain-containing protein [Bacillus sp. FJAT-29814]
MRILMVLMLSLFLVFGCSREANKNNRTTNQGEIEQVNNDNGTATQGKIVDGKIQGYIVFLKDSDITILISDKNFNIIDMNLSLKELQVKYNDLMLLILDEVPLDIKSGEKVKIGFSKILESYPPKVEVTEIVRMDN